MTTLPYSPIPEWALVEASAEADRDLGTWVRHWLVNGDLPLTESETFHDLLAKATDAGRAMRERSEAERRAS